MMETIRRTASSRNRTRSPDTVRAYARTRTNTASSSVGRSNLGTDRTRSENNAIRIAMDQAAQTGEPITLITETATASKAGMNIIVPIAILLGAVVLKKMKNRKKKPNVK